MKAINPTYRCNKCHRTKAVSEFPKNGTAADGWPTIRPSCKKCHTKDKTRRYREAHPDAPKRASMSSRRGETYGKLTITGFSGYRVNSRGRKVPMMVCLCACGKKKRISYRDLRQGRTKTCGLGHPHYEDRSMPAFNHIYEHSYRRRAEKAGLRFAITRDEFRTLSQEPCHYCGSEPQSCTYRGNRGTARTGNQVSQFVYNGLDRVDSRKGYTTSNVVTCCGICNHAKHTMSYKDFTAWLDRVAVTRAKRDLILTAALEAR